MSRFLEMSGKYILGCGLIIGLFVGRDTAHAAGFKVLHSFCSETNCSDGTDPAADLIMDENGNLYGTTELGGAHGVGVVFSVARNGTETVLYAFCPSPQNDCSDGANPNAGLVRDAKGNLYGTTHGGGTGHGGTIFVVARDGKERVLYSFRACCGDGSNPDSDLIQDSQGNLYGTTQAGGAKCGSGGCGTVFKLARDGKETVLYSFCVKSNCSDGEYPESGLVMDLKGNLYGITQYGGDSANCSNGCGLLYELSPRGKETVLHSFCVKAGCSDGSSPYGGLLMDGNDTLYGTTSAGGAQGKGAVFRWTPATNEKVLYSFCPAAGCSDGALPYSTLVMDIAGNLYGTANSGGAQNRGAVFKVTPAGKETTLYSFCSQTNCSDGSYPVAGLTASTKGLLYGTAEFGGAGSSCQSPSGCGTLFTLKE